MNTNQHSIVFSRDLTPRIVAIVVVLMLALSAIPMVSNPVGADGSGTYPAPAAGDWVISNETSVWNETIILKGNLTIENGGKLILNNVTLLFDSSSDGEFGITVKDGGELQVLGKKEVTKGARLRGDYDLFSGTNGGQVSFYKNAGTLAEPDWQEPVSLRDGGGDTIDVGDRSAPFFGDLDNDGDMDLIVGERRDSGQVNYYENTGTTEFPEWTRDDSMFSGVTAGGHSKPTLADTDNDGDLDLTTGSDSEGGEVYYFENTGTPQEASWGSREDLQDKDGQHINMDSRCWPTYADLDNDGDMDLTIGRSSGDDGQIFYYKNTGT